MTSVEKVRAFIDGDGFDGDESSARQRMMMRALSPIIAAQLPSDAAELDTLLERGALFCLTMRSDDAPAIESLEQLLELAGVYHAEIPDGAQLERVRRVDLDGQDESEPT